MSTARKLAPAGIAAVLALTIAPAAQAQTTATPIPAGSASSVAAAGRHASAQDKWFLRQAHQGNLAEIAAGKAALRESRDKGVRAIAWRLVQDHGKLDARLREVARRLHVSLPDRPSAAQRADLWHVQKRDGRRFDRAWLRLQEDAHVQTLQLIRRELRDGHSRWVKDLADDAAPVVRHHLRAIRAER
ncbi:DUF4142 domain-containing protein [Actinomadura sp. ATCC 31491]|uniref:DUF4142 domain-containing protein n=1 Tax=Actinomadura luzonensis TaxID=2805427 RepID=A0ABT0G4I6_9ACTN|nr:DUF4142 domain-containing protein [Actinomadura luzonensis]MCK2219105.1 DUF4142 domain-containing protein [Actinomadura luzonensis]